MNAMTIANGTTKTSGADLVARVVANGGDLEGLKPIERAEFYARVCESMGLNPLTQPFKYIKLNGQLRLYALKDATEQLRQIHKIAIVIVDRQRTDDLMVITARATSPDGRTDESVGAVSIAGLKGENLANALMKAETKAKRRVTLSICGLGWLDETEVDDIKAAKRVEVTVAGEIVQPLGPVDLTEQLSKSVDWVLWVDDHFATLRAAAKDGRGAFNEAWADIADEVKRLQPAADIVKSLNEGKNEIKASMGWS